MLTNRRLTMTADILVNDTRIAIAGAIVNVEAGTVQFAHKHIDPGACEECRDIVRKECAKFENFAYDIKNDIKGMLTAETATAEEETA